MGYFSVRSFFSFRRVAAAACVCADRRFFGMQSDWTGLRREFVEKLGESLPAWKTSGHDIASECLGFHDGNVRFARDGKKIIGCAAPHEAGCPKMIRQRDLVHAFSIDPQRPNPAANKCARFNRRAQANDANVITIFDAELARKLR